MKNHESGRERNAPLPTVILKSSLYMNKIVDKDQSTHKS